MPKLWICPKCGFVVGWVDADHNLIVWHYPEGFITIRSAEFTCSCGYRKVWAKAS